MFRRRRAAADLPDGVVVGTLGAHDHAVVGPDGSVRPGGASLGFDWVTGAGDEWIRPSATRASAVSQHLVDGLPIVETAVRVPGGQVVQRVWCVADGGAELAVMEIENRSKEAVSVALAVTSSSPGSFRATTSDPMRLVGEDAGRRAVAVCARRPARVLLGPYAIAPGATSDDREDAPYDLGAGAAYVWPLAHTASLRVAVVLDGEWDGPPDALPDVESVVRGWRTHIDAGARLSLPDPGLDAATVTARAALLVRGRQPHAPEDAGAVAAALEAWGHHDAADAAVEQLLDGQRYDGSLGDPQATASAITAWSAHVRTGSDAHAAERLAEPVAKAAHRLAKVRWKSTPPPWFATAQRDAAALLDRAQQPEAADLCRRRVGGDPTPVPAVTLAELLALAPGAGSVDLGGDVALLRTLHRFLVDDTTAGRLTLVPAWPDEWLGAGVEVHRLPTRAGLLSFAVRWHGPRPALLWELEADGAVELHAGLDPAWVATDPVGEALLSPVEPAGGLPGVVAPLTGEATPVDEAPDDGVSFR